ncbi:ATP-binding cassette domain-containing protein [Streptomyces himalayensis]|uniref:ATP-binding cassette domain-containing protein n=1 Tax=Streptomyces himalayensis subsp. himalayensis TaxID=2756131 RepID=A0A7W0DJS4_9ACTN|nr:ATP-binding cassette domain-containing protein [Streptomyces himalayensis]MBA2946407.1 ATP-binding cassette domain-containing protein [Streptomyces himalayensis subsp. himalayensis]
MTLLLDRVTFRYHRWDRPVLSSFSYEVPGEGLTILLGPNGAGKSTTMSLLAGTVEPLAGRVLLKDSALTSASREYRRHVAWLPQRVPTSRQLTAREYVAYVAWLKGENRTSVWERAGAVLDQVGLAEQSGQKTAKLSGGQLRRVGIACALAHDARVILLDEPTAGLDPHQRTVFRDLLRKVAARIPVLMSTHDIADLADEANTVSLMDRGRILHHGGTQSFLDHARPDAAPARQAESAYSVLMGLEGTS